MASGRCSGGGWSSEAAAAVLGCLGGGGDDGDAPGTIDSVALFERLHNEHTLIPFPRGTHWHSTFGHLVHYGAGYYSYLLARVVAAGLWHRCFAADPLSRDAGEQLRRELLSMGNARDPQSMLEALLGKEYGLGGVEALLKIQDGYMDEVYGGEEAKYVAEYMRRQAMTAQAGG